MWIYISPNLRISKVNQWHAHQDTSNLSKIKKKKESWNNKRNVTQYKGCSKKLTVNLSSETSEARRQWENIVKVFAAREGKNS